MLIKIVIKIIKFYQAAISPYFGRNCRFYPSCSEYMVLAVKKKGLFLGVFSGVKRISRCHHLSP
ncbi:MAG: membrane protein insertion efficiency factor YidD, partial [Candidatus Nealsonbacteria bacterium CG23_combo_of_CG06-09_8_20_14_all_38_19]